MATKHRAVYLRMIFTFSLIFSVTTLSCTPHHEAKTTPEPDNTSQIDSLPPLEAPQKPTSTRVKAQDIELKDSLIFEKYTLEDEYLYKDTPRKFQWDKIKELIAHIENAMQKSGAWGVLSNYKNLNGEAPTVKNFHRDEYKRVSDTYGTERYQSAPLYDSLHTDSLLRYGQDGWLTRILSFRDDTLIVEGISFEGKYAVPKRYVTIWGDSISIEHLAIVDRTNQNIATLEKRENTWHILSKNPSTTGRYKPPYAKYTPIGIFALQEKKSKMFYVKDGTNTIQGYAPFAVRFTCGAYIHGVPTQSPTAPIIEYSPSLGTIPRSHMCVRNASSHAKFIFERMPVKKSLVMVIE